MLGRHCRQQVSADCQAQEVMIRQGQGLGPLLAVPHIAIFVSMQEA